MRYTCDTLSSADTNKLIGILSRLSSDFEGERAAAGLLATKFIKQRGLGWQDILQPALPPPPEPEEQSSARTWQAVRADILTVHGDCLTDWEHDFLCSLGNYRKLSFKQFRAFQRIANKCGVEL